MAPQTRAAKRRADELEAEQTGYHNLRSGKKPKVVHVPRVRRRPTAPHPPPAPPALGQVPQPPPQAPQAPQQQQQQPQQVQATPQQQNQQPQQQQQLAAVQDTNAGAAPATVTGNAPANSQPTAAGQQPQQQQQPQQAAGEGTNASAVPAVVTVNAPANPQPTAARKTSPELPDYESEEEAAAHQQADDFLANVLASQPATTLNADGTRGALLHPQNTAPVAPHWLFEVEFAQRHNSDLPILLQLLRKTKKASVEEVLFVLKRRCISLKMILQDERQMEFYAFLDKYQIGEERNRLEFCMDPRIVLRHAENQLADAIGELDARGIAYKIPEDWTWNDWLKWLPQALKSAPTDPPVAPIVPPIASVIPPVAPADPPIAPAIPPAANPMPTTEVEAGDSSAELATGPFHWLQHSSDSAEAIVSMLHELKAALRKARDANKHEKDNWPNSSDGDDVRPAWQALKQAETRVEDFVLQIKALGYAMDETTNSVIIVKDYDYEDDFNITNEYAVTRQVVNVSDAEARWSFDVHPGAPFSPPRRTEFGSPIEEAWHWRAGPIPRPGYTGGPGRGQAPPSSSGDSTPMDISPGSSPPASPAFMPGISAQPPPPAFPAPPNKPSNLPRPPHAPPSIRTLSPSSTNVEPLVVSPVRRAGVFAQGLRRGVIDHARLRTNPPEITDKDGERHDCARCGDELGELHRRCYPHGDQDSVHPDSLDDLEEGGESWDV